MSNDTTLLDLEWDFPQIGRTTIRGYFCALLARVWADKEDFDFKRAFGFAHWQRDLLPPLIAAGAIEPVSVDCEKDRAKALLEQKERLDELISSLIPQIATPKNENKD